MSVIPALRPYDSTDAKLVSSLVACYREVFAGPPWNEQWEESAVREVLAGLRPTGNFVAIYDGVVIGFAFGRSERMRDLEAWLRVPIVEPLERLIGSGQDAEPVFYQADLGVLPKYRGHKLATQLFWNRFTATEESYFIVRTREYPDSSVTYDWYTRRLGYRILSRYPEQDGRAILFQTRQTLQILLQAHRIRMF